MAELVKFQILVFGAAKKIIGASSLTVQLEQPVTILSCKIYLKHQYPEMQSIPFVLAKNEVYAEDMDTIRSGDFIAIIPPVSGG